MEQATINESKNGNQPAIKPKRKQRSVGIPQIQSINSMQGVTYRGYIEAQPVDWEALSNYDFYSPTEDGSNLMIKITKSKSLDIKTQKPITTTFGRAYRVHIQQNPVIDHKRAD